MPPVLPLLAVPTSSHESPALPAFKPIPASKRPKKRKALLIGITYSKPGGEGSLKGPHRDVECMKNLLLDVYNYDPKDVIVLRDTGNETDIPPTRVNMIEQIQLLVRGAQTGDRFVFHYAGHGTQIENFDRTEEDGLDEALLPVDAPDGADYVLTREDVVMDDWLRETLVDLLPAGATLMTIIDACHSGSMLDLDHMKCNRVYVPWISKGFRASKTKFHDVERQDAGLLGDDKSSPIRRTRSHGSGTGKVKGSQPRKRKTFHWPAIIEIIEGDESSHEPFYIPLCTTPTQDDLYPCDGWCRGRNLPESITANAICLASADDPQISWEDKDGSSMTQALVELLRRNSQPTYQEVLTFVSHTLHGITLNRHQDALVYRQRWKAWVARMKKRGLSVHSASNTPDMDNFQDPQLSSQMHLNMQDRWIL